MSEHPHQQHQQQPRRRHRAVLCDAYGPIERLRLADVPALPPAARGHLVISVHACGVNFPDVLLVQGKYQVRPQLPFAAGGEVAGVVRDVGAGVTRFRPGDRVIGFCGYGGFASEVAVPETAAAPLPPAMDSVTAAGFLVAYMTSYYGLKLRGKLQRGETLLVLGGAGGCGLAAIQLGKAMGARVLAVASTPEKRQTCIAVGGADATLEYSDGGRVSLRKQVQQATGGRGVDVVFDPVGGAVTEEAVRCLGQYGRLLVVGFAAGDIPRLPINLLLLRQASLIGVFMGQWAQRSPDQFAQLVQELVDMQAQGSIKPLISAVFPLQRAAEALAVVRDRRIQGKAVVTVNEQGAAQAAASARL